VLLSIFFIFSLILTTFYTIKSTRLPFDREHLAALLHNVPETFALQDVIITADVPFHKQELYHLLLSEHQTLSSRTQLHQGLFYLVEKRSFSYATLTTDICTKGRLNIRLHLEGAPIFSKLHVISPLVDKDPYHYQYFFEPGQPFNEHHHKQALQSMLDALHDDGYYDAHLTVTSTLDTTTKHLEITITVDPGDRYKIEDIALVIKTSSTYNTTDAYRLKHILTTKLKGQFLCLKLLDNIGIFIINRAQEEGFFDTKLQLTKKLNPEKKSAFLTFTLTPHSRRMLECVGNHFFTEKEILATLAPFGIARSFLPPLLLAQEIETLYKKNGFLDVTVTWKECSEKIFFCISEGQRAQIKNITFSGLIHGNPDEVRASYFGDILQQLYLDEEKLNQALHRFAYGYFQKGFWDFKIIDKKYIKNGSNATITLHITVEEYKRRILRNITIEPQFQSFLDAASEQITPKIQSYPCPFDIYLLQNYEVALKTTLYRAGYLYAVPLAELKDITINENQHIVTLHWNIIGIKNPVTFGKTILSGNTTLSPLILRELLYKEGQPWDQNKVDASLQRLHNLSLLSTVSLHPLQMETPTPRKDLILTYSEDDPFEIRTRIGAQIFDKNFTWSNGANYSLGGSFSWKNPTNNADYLQYEIDITRNNQFSCISYTLPWIFNLPLQTELRLSINQTHTPAWTGSHEMLYKTLSGAFTIACNREYGRLATYILAGFELRNIHQLSPHLTHLLGINTSTNNLSRVCFIEPTVSYTHLDNHLQPTRGFSGALTLRTVFQQYIKSPYVRIIAHYTQFIPLPFSTIAALRFQWGHIFNSTLQSLLPTDRFYLGGASSIRGYDPHMVPPLINYCDQDGTQHSLAIGGTSFFNFNMELRFPLSLSLQGVIFTDIGSLAPTFSLYKNYLVGASGFGIRYTTPVGPLRFDIGWKWNPLPCESNYAWFLAIGHVF
jgi:outer membrane protein assembly factor BamA